ncbi:unnamed protein product [Moneuplotes crassus]|uniref:Uncharacterized protein n=1 Tax=Euplotes crassus TaxID=5936 RepID=A0AAD1Y3Q1_EUPCR|nr:unnamed protein product [Moneuplotes crassus]
MRMKITASCVIAIAIFLGSSLAAPDRRDTLYISSLITHGERTPLFTGNAEYQVTGVNYDQGPGRITVTGERSLSARGQQLKNDYGNGRFFETNYVPDDIFVRSINDQKSIIGAYSYLLGSYPDSLDGVTLESDIEKLNDIPVTNYDVNTVRSNLNLGNPRSKTTQAKIHPGNPDALFLTQVGKTYPGQREKIDQQLFEAKNEYERTHGTRFYEDFARAIHKPDDNINFYSAYKYADDIIAAQANGQRSAVNLSPELQNDLDVYYGHYFGDGLFRDYDLNRAFSHNYLSSVAHELQLKMEDDQSGDHKNEQIHSMKQTVYSGNQLTLLSALHLFNEVENYRVDFNDELRFQLFRKDGKYFVRSTLNDQPLRLEGTNNPQGEAEWSAFRDYICSKLYYGSVKNVRDGTENPERFTRLRESCDNVISHGVYANDRVQKEPSEISQYKPDEPTQVQRIEPPLRQATSPSILTNNDDVGIRRQPVDINVGKTSQEVQYAWNKPVKLRQTQWEPFELPMKKEFTFETNTKKEVSLNQYRKVKLDKTVNKEISLAERHSFNFESELLMTREINFNNVDMLKIPQYQEKSLYLADKHPFNWGDNPSLSTKELTFTYAKKIKIPETMTSKFSLPERHVFNYNTESKESGKVNFDHIKSVRVPQAEAYDVNLQDLKLDRLREDQYQDARRSSTTDNQYGSNPVQQIEERSPQTEQRSPRDEQRNPRDEQSNPRYEQRSPRDEQKSTSKKPNRISLGGNVETVPDYVAPIRIKQQYNSYESSFTNSQPNNNYIYPSPQTSNYISNTPTDRTNPQASQSQSYQTQTSQPYQPYQAPPSDRDYPSYSSQRQSPSYTHNYDAEADFSYSHQSTPQGSNRSFGSTYT